MMKTQAACYPARNTRGQ